MPKSLFAALLAAGLLLTAGAGAALAKNPFPNATTSSPAQCGAEGEQDGNNEDVACNTDATEPDTSGGEHAAGAEQNGDMQTGESGTSGPTNEQHGDNED